ncbi:MULTISPECIES: VWA domain-containing protein [unclassified Rhodococcus (in: high G+C Gram-positive bacteria)]|uniref:VWA domain-containing protein n=1 Tax=unclassified Rhodococcus (in: high G+C Gram-positive bacteria) TaxID=192944 RepID=UPI00163A3B83|nr:MULTISPECIES: VWA domain-containing protein [unclassified Rhodococcus (in: high G+C Gram-positive bacteria)]MBC2638245.1 VWA domain-containing protein [Rhodococcus sp. 3A]MBC2897013.1 VWA domain-containing protein [Rhodococcus sp. 4CII]
MTLSGFTAPWWLLFAVAVVALLAGYLWVQRLRHVHVLRFTNLALLEKVAPTRPKLSRHVPTALLLVGLVMLTVAMAGPTAAKRVPRNRATVILVIDVSLSMRSTDVQPSRLAAAQDGAKSFADSLTPGINLGLESFAGTASMLVSPVTDHNATKNAVDHLQLAERTATGEAIFTALQAIDQLSEVLGGSDQPPPAQIVLESDGKQTVPTNLDDPRGAFTAARLAKEKNVSISTISFGTTHGTVDIQGQPISVPVDDASLRQIADLSGGAFFSATSADELQSSYQSLQEQIGYETQLGDASRPWLILGSVFTALAAGTALVLTRRLP